MSRKNVITALGIFKKEAAPWVANRAWSPLCLCLISSLCYCSIHPIHLLCPCLIIPFGKREHSLKPTRSYRFTGELANTWPRASIVHLSIARQKQSWICQMGAKLPGRTNMGFFSSIRPQIFMTVIGIQRCFRVLLLSQMWLKLAWIFVGTGGGGGKKERVREKTELKIATFGFFLAIYLGILENVMCNIIPIFFPLKTQNNKHKLIIFILIQ